ncbi:MAG: hypothetical protein KIG22_05645, partial [Oxalobacter sp.]|nr:hypothetical protein [Oxalobacter sp.]
PCRMTVVHDQKHTVRSIKYPPLSWKSSIFSILFTMQKILLASFRVSHERNVMLDVSAVKTTAGSPA